MNTSVWPPKVIAVMSSGKICFQIIQIYSNVTRNNKIYNWNWTPVGVTMLEKMALPDLHQLDAQLV